MNTIHLFPSAGRMDDADTWWSGVVTHGCPVRQRWRQFWFEIATIRKVTLAFHPNEVAALAAEQEERNP